MAAEQPAPPEQAPPPPPGGRSKQFVFLILIVLIGQVGIGYWAVYRLLLPKMKAEEEGVIQEKTEELAGAEEKHGEEGGGGHGGEKKEGGEGGNPNVHGDLLDVGRVTASTIQGGELHYVILTTKIKFDSPEAAQEAGENLSRVRDIVLHVVSVKPGEELDDVQDQERLREAIKQEVSAKMTKGKAEEVYFTQYVYQ